MSQLSTDTIATQPPAELQETAPQPTTRTRITRIAQSHTYGFAFSLFVVLMVVTLIQDHGNFGLTDQLANVAPVTIAALASAPAIIGGGFDVSISPLIFFCNAAYVVWLAPHGLGGVVAIPIILGLGMATSLLAGLIIAYLRVQAIVVTLALYFTLQGVDLLMAPNPVQMTNSTWVWHLGASVGPIPGGVFTIGIPLLIWLALRRFPFRRLLYAIGSNDATAFSSGVNVNAVRVASYALGGLFAGIGGLALTSVVHATNASQATEYTLVAIAGVVLGGTALTGGRGGLIGPMFAAFSIFLLQNLLSTYQVNEAWLQIVYGLILIIAVIIQGVLTPEATVGGLRPRRMPLWHRNARRSHGIAPTAMTAGGTEAEAHAVAEISSERGPGSVAGQVWGSLKRAQQRIPLIQIVALIAVFAYGAATLPGLDTWVSIRSILVLAALIGLASCGQTLLILMGGFDLGVSGFIVAGGLTVTALNLKYDIPIGVALAFAILASGFLGSIAGYICHRFRINPLVVTLAMGTLAVGIVEVQNGGLADGNAAQSLINLAEPVTKTFGVGLPPSVAIWILVIILFALFLHRTKVGRNLMATGANPRAADYALINTRRVWVAAFAFSAAASALVGVLIAGFAGVVVGTGGDAYLFQSVVAVIVGGTVFGGPGDYTRTAIGALFLTVLGTVLIGHGASVALQDVIYGVIILVAVATYGRERRLRDRL